jgi:eukaryotic-like serine/threonine-protein kinase
VTPINVERLLRETPISVAPSSLDAVHQRLFGAAKRRAPEHYEIHEELGRGAFGRVYRAIDERYPREVALKVIHYRSARQLARLEREARALAGLAHPNIVTIFDKGIADAGVYFLATERVDGTRLDTWMHDPARRLPEILEVFAQAAEGLHHAHQRGMIHRDFKPANAIVDRDGRLRILDFGLVELAGIGEAEPRPAAGETVPEGVIPLVTASSHAHHDPTRSSEWSRGDGAPDGFRGTAAYAAPEQLDGAAVDSRSDQFSLCVALFEACHGFRPFSGRTVLELSEQMAAGDVARGASRHRVPRWLERLLRRGLSPSPADRFDDVGEIATVLRAHLRPTPWLAMAAGMALTLGLAGSLWAATRPPEVPLPSALAWPEGATASRIEADYGPGLRRGLEQYQVEWKHARDQYAVRPDREAEGPVVQCLQTAEQRFRDFVTHLNAPAPQRVPQAVSSERLWLAHFSAPEDCLSEPREGTLDALVSQLLEAQAARLAGQYDEALERLESMRDEPELQRVPASGRFGYELGLVQLRRWDPTAWRTLMAASQDTGDDRELLVEVLSRQLEAGVVLQAAQPAEIEHVLSLIRQRSRALGPVDAVPPIEWLAEGYARFGQGRHREAKQAYARAREAFAALEPSPHRDLMIAHSTLNEAYVETNEEEPHIDADAVEAALAQMAALLGNEHPTVHRNAIRVARIIAYEGRIDAARRLLVAMEATLAEASGPSGSPSFDLVRVQAELLWLDLEQHANGEGMDGALRSKVLPQWSARAAELDTRLNAIEGSLGSGRRADVGRVREILASARSAAGDAEE